MTFEQAKSELMQIYGALSPNKQRAIDTLVKIEPCEDAISRQAVLDINESHHGQMSNHINHQIWQEIKDLPPVNPQVPKYCDRNICIKNEYNGIGCDECEVTKSQEPKWIPVSERLPYNHEYIKNNGLFNVSDGNRSYSEYFDIYDTERFGEPTMSGFRVDRCVVAWMPLPKPYEPQESEDKE